MDSCSRKVGGSQEEMKIRVGEKRKPNSEANKMGNLRSVGLGRKREWYERVVPSTTTYKVMGSDTTKFFIHLMNN